ncbi:MAG: tetraacyldisaccharide 4'-kinase [Gallionella sp.]|nr:tetraacyldisaccharide 4'-kinase [Gallionella sp.]
MFKLEHHWYRITPLHLILFPVSLVFRVLVALRRALYRNHIFSSDQLLLPVIVVGNISVGGTGKTPLTLALAEQLVERGWHPLIISRGYGGKSQRPQHVAADSTAQQVGDEPLLMARRDICPVWIGRDRATTAHAAMQIHPQCDIVLCDDGLQHYRLQRDAEIAVIDGARGFGNGFMLPAGPLREPVARLQSVDAVVINVQARFPDETPSHSTKQPQDGCQVAGYLPNTLPEKPSPQPSPASWRGGKRDKQFLIPAGEGANESLREFISDDGDILPGQYTMHLSGELFYSLLDPGKTVAAAHFHAIKNHAVAGIGHPQRYFQHLERMGISFTPHAFPDHHPYSAEDLAFANCDAILLTEKDAVKCTAFADARYWVLRVDAKIDSTLIDHILRKIAPHGLQTA